MCKFCQYKYTADSNTNENSGGKYLHTFCAEENLVFSGYFVIELVKCFHFLTFTLSEVQSASNVDLVTEYSTLGLIKFICIFLYSFTL